MVMALYARADHPEGYGQGKRAHGYVVLMVRCRDEDEVARVSKVMASDFKGKPEGGYNDGALLDWYGGNFDLLAILPGAEYAHLTFPGPNMRFVSKGDNRFVGLYTADEVLNEPYRGPER